MSPIFSTVNMKKVAPIIEEKVAKLIEKLGQKSADRDGGEGLDIYKLFQNLTLDVIAQTCK